MASAKVVKPKKRCCQSRPRCKRCPTVLKRLSQQGLADRREDGRWVVTAGGGQIKAARKGRTKR